MNMKIDPDNMSESYNDLVLQFDKLTKEKLDLEGKYEVLQGAYTYLENLSTDLMKTNNLLNKKVEQATIKLREGTADLQVSESLLKARNSRYTELNKAYNSLKEDYETVKSYQTLFNNCESIKCNLEDKLEDVIVDLNNTEAHCLRERRKYGKLVQKYNLLDEMYQSLLETKNSVKSLDEKASKKLEAYKKYAEWLYRELEKEIIDREKIKETAKSCQNDLANYDKSASTVRNLMQKAVKSI